MKYLATVEIEIEAETADEADELLSENLTHLDATILGVEDEGAPLRRAFLLERMGSE